MNASRELEEASRLSPSAQSSGSRYALSARVLLRHKAVTLLIVGVHSGFKIIIIEISSLSGV